MTTTTTFDQTLEQAVQQLDGDLKRDCIVFPFYDIATAATFIRITKMEFKAAGCTMTKTDANGNDTTMFCVVVKKSI